MKAFQDMAAVTLLLQKAPRTRIEIAEALGWHRRDSVRRITAMLQALIGEGLVKEIEPVRSVNRRGGTTRCTRRFEWVG